jgi:hypothetical protein
MITNEITAPTAPALREQLQSLEQERALAALTGLADNDRYMADLLDELQAVQNAYIGSAVTEIASLRAALGAPLRG